MKKNINLITNIQPLIALITTFGIYMPIYSCVITLTNDSDGKIFVVDANGMQGHEILKGKTKKFGDAHKKGKFAIFSKKNKARVYNLACTCQQNACMGDGKPHLKYSDLINGTGDTVALFTINKK